MDSAQRAERRRVFLSGVRDGVPIGLGYLAVAFSLGIAARNAGLNMIGVAWGFRGRAALEAAGAPLVADTPEQLLDMLQ